MDSFFQDSDQYLKGLLICSDIRRIPSEQDIQMIDWALYYNIPFIFLATKADKVSKSKRPQYVARIAASIHSRMGDSPNAPIIAVSSVSRIGADNVLAAMNEMLQAARSH